MATTASASPALRLLHPATSRRRARLIAPRACSSPTPTRRGLIADTATLAIAATTAPLLLPRTTHAAEPPLSEWERVGLPIDPGVVLLDIAFVPDDPSHGFLLGTRQTILETKDGGATWFPRSIPSAEDEDFNYRFNSVSFSGREGWIVGKPAILLHTRDAGDSWERIPLSAQLPGDMVYIQATGEQSAEMVTDEGAIYVTSNRGYNWKAAVQETVSATLNRRATRENLNLLPELLSEEQIVALSPVEVLLPDLLAEKLSDTSPSATEHVYSYVGEENNSCQKSCVCNSSGATADSFSKAWNSDNCGNCSIDIEGRLSITDENKQDGLQHGASTGVDNVKSTHAEDVTDSRSHTERVQCSSEACSSKMFLPVSSGRSGRRSRETSSCNNSTATNRVAGANRQRRSGKDSAVSVWQKVEKINKEKSSGEGHVVVSAVEDKSALEDTNKGAQHDPNRPMDKHRCKNSCKQRSLDVAVEMGLTTENGALNPCRNFSRCVCKKQTPFLYEQTSLSCKMSSCQSSINYYAPKNGIPKMPENHSQPMEGLSMLQLVYARDINDRPFATCIEKATLAPYNLDSHSVPQAMSKEACSLVIQDDTHSPCLENKTTSTDLDSRNLSTNPCPAEMEETQCVKSYSAAAHMSHKWVPVGKRDIIHFEVPKASGAEVSVSANDVSVHAIIDLQRNDSDVPGSTKCDGSEVPTEMTAKLNLSGQPDSKCQGHTETGTAFSKITDAVNDAYRAQQRAEDIKLLIGRPIADFEQFIYSASPVLHCTSCPIGCSSSSQERGRDRLCFHQTADISLSSIWQWYEEPGCYGLEVKAQDLRRSKDVWNSRSQFNAYFVPYLSAVQLFGLPKRTIDKDAADITGPRSETSPSLKSLPILAKLLPQESNQRNKPSALHIKDDQQSETTEPVFEFFESEQPFWRRQLFDKVKELIHGAKQSNCRISGDPKNLELNLHDLHPASWYCVAWYPIYRIPDGKFQAAFLTYHSLGHWVRRRSSSDQAGHSHAVLPVMGLQSYNDKGEWWFQTSRPGGSEDATEPADCSHDPPPSQVLREMVSTLRQAAAAMARADVPSKDQTRSRNRHPDYEFFLSRYR